jgi:hypothetical protein
VEKKENKLPACRGEGSVAAGLQLRVCDAIAVLLAALETALALSPQCLSKATECQLDSLVSQGPTAFGCLESFTQQPEPQRALRMACDTPY